MSVRNVWTWSWPEGVKFSETGIMDGSGLLEGAGNQTPGPLEEQPLLWTTESSLQPSSTNF